MRDRYASLREGLVGAWIPSVSGSGLLLPDLSGNGNNGTLTNMGPEDWVSSQYGRALDFDGSNDYVTMGSPSKLQLNGEITVSAWVLPRSTSRLAICNHSSSATAYWAFVFSFGSNQKISFWNSAAGPTVTATNISDLNYWHHFVATRSASGVSLYLNGILDASAAGSTGNGTGATELALGRAGSFNSYLASSILDDVRIYNRALSEPEIKLLASRPGIGLRPQRRTMYYAPSTGARRRRILTSMP